MRGNYSNVSSPMEMLELASLQSAISRRNKVEIETPPTTQVQRHRPVEGVPSIQAPAQYQQGGGGSDSESDDADLDSDGGADDVKTCTLINQISSVKTCSFVRRRIRMSYPGTSTYCAHRASIWLPNRRPANGRLGVIQ